MKVGEDQISLQVGSPLRAWDMGRPAVVSGEGEEEGRSQAVGGTARRVRGGGSQRHELEVAPTHVTGCGFSPQVTTRA